MQPRTWMAHLASHSYIVLSAALAGCGLCETEVLNRVPSPNGELHAVRWYGSCGAMHSGTVGVNLLAADQAFDPDDHLNSRTVFQYRAELMGGSRDTVVVVSSRADSTPVVPDTVAWTSNSELVIAYDDRRPVIRQMIRLGDVRIAFRAYRPAITEPPQN